jgi:xanthine dehydrogenase FAD-binding subunit
MIPRFEFHRPVSLAEALRVLDEKRNTVVIAGGTDVITGMQQGDSRFVTAESVLDISHLPELRQIAVSGSETHMGAAVPFSEIVASPLLQSSFPLLTQASSLIGSVQIRNRATLAGNFVNNAACADSVPPLLIYDAQVVIRSSSAERRMPIGEFLLKPNRTALQAGELVTEIVLPKVADGYRGSFLKLGRRRGIAISRITLAVMLRQAEGKVSDLRVASGAVAPIGVRFRNLESQAIGKRVGDSLWIELAQRLGEAVLEKTGMRWSSPYKLPVVQQMFYKLLCEIARGSRS